MAASFSRSLDSFSARDVVSMLAATLVYASELSRINFLKAAFACPLVLKGEQCAACPNRYKQNRMKRSRILNYGQYALICIQ